MLFKHGSAFFGLPNPLEGVDRPRSSKKPVLTLSLEGVASLDKAPQDTTERLAWEILQGHGWRQIEVRRITAGDIRRARDGIIWCRGKERAEPAPILPETLELLLELATKRLGDDEPVLRSRRIRQGTTQPLGEDGLSQLLGRLFTRAGIEVKGHDLRRTFATLVRQTSRDEFLAMRLIRDKIPGVNDRYISYPLGQLVADLARYSPLRLIRSKETGPGSEPVVICGGDGGELNSPSSDIALTLSHLLDQLVALGQMAHEIRHALGANGHRAELLSEITQYIEHRVSK
ncbi:hypothetical protein ES705_26309 [subsurface metagenome]